MALTHLHAQALARQPAADKYDPSFPASDALATLGDPVECQFQCLRPVHACLLSMKALRTDTSSFPQSCAKRSLSVWAECWKAACSSALIGKLRISIAPLRPTIVGRLRAILSTPYCPVIGVLTVRTVRWSRSTASTIASNPRPIA